MADKRAKLLVSGLIGTLLFAGILASRMDRLPARVLEGDAYLLIQIMSDYDRDGDIDFLDFTVFSAFYEETV